MEKLEEFKTEFKERMTDQLTRVITVERKGMKPLDEATATEVSQILADGLAEDSVLIVDGTVQQTVPPEKMGILPINLKTADALEDIRSNVGRNPRLRMDALKYSMNALAAHQTTDAIVALSTAEGLWYRSSDQPTKTLIETSPHTMAAIVKVLPKIDPSNFEGADFVDVLDVLEHGSPSNMGYPSRPRFRDEDDRAKLLEVVKGMGDERFTAFVEKRNELRKKK
jgi:hypothetical protein